MAEKPAPSFPLALVVLCGGSGSRLWPRSRAALPKPFIALPDGGGTLIDRTYARLQHCPLRPAAVLTAVAADHAFLCAESFARCAGAAADRAVPHWIVAEPTPRDTGPAAAMAAEICRRRLGDDAVLLVLPADHLIVDERGFWEAALRAMRSAAAGKFSLLGITPDHPATGYGYIHRGAAAGDGLFEVRRFVEKPERARAAEFLQSGEYYWNAGVFCFAAGALHAVLPQLRPDWTGPLRRATAAAGAAGDLSSSTFSPEQGAVAEMSAISFDRAVMERLGPGAATVADAAGIGWSDAGSWRALGATLPADAAGNRVSGEAVLHNARDCVVVGEAGRLIAAADVSGLHVIDSPDALLVCSAAGSENTREIFSRLRGRPAAETPTTVRRPWGSYAILHAGAGYQVKRLDVAPGAQLSLQSHRRRSEHWTAVLGRPTVTVGEREFDLPRNESCFIPLGARHRLANRTAAAAAVIEVQVGDYLGEDDIVRYEDMYGRA